VSGQDLITKGRRGSGGLQGSEDYPLGPVTPWHRSPTRPSGAPPHGRLSDTRQDTRGCRWGRRRQRRGRACGCSTRRDPVAGVAGPLRRMSSHRCLWCSPWIGGALGDAPGELALVRGHRTSGDVPPAAPVECDGGPWGTRPGLSQSRKRRGCAWESIGHPVGRWEVR
jgi:hypothetical protein